MTVFNRTVLACCLLLAAGGCKIKPVENVDFKEVNREIQARKIKRLNDAEVSQYLYKAAKALADTALAQWGQADSSLCAQADFSCWAKDDLALLAEYEVLCRLPANRQGKEAQVWSAYRYNLENDLTLADNLQRLSPDRFLYTVPLTENTNSGTPMFLRLVVKQGEVIKRVNMKEVLRNK